MGRRRIAMDLDLSRQCPSERWPARTVRPSDAEDLAILLYASFRSTVDDEGETFADARAEIERTLDGGYGRFLPDASFVIEQGEFLASACLVSWFEPHDAPLVVFSMTRPEAQRRGMARDLLRRSTNALLDAGYRRLTLIVTVGNTAAERLYASLGFTPIAG